MQPITFHLLFLQISIISIHFPPHMQPVTFYLPFLLISITFINKCAKIPLCLFNVLAIAFANLLIHKHPNEHPLGCLSHHSSWNKCPIICGIYILFTWNLYKGCYRTLPFGGTPSSVFKDTYNYMATENKTYFPWSFITQFVAIFTMKDLLKIKTS